MLEGRSASWLMLLWQRVHVIFLVRGALEVESEAQKERKERQERP